MAKRKQKTSRNVDNKNTFPPSICPAVSVIIPLYNAERYIAECLDSVLAQTFQNYEVIVVDDCSTDSSPVIVQSYIPKFGGRLKLSRMFKNTGKPSLPRNKGLAVSRGEYIYFMDNDDLITPTALEELYTLAKDYDTEVVYCEKYYICGENRVNLQLSSIQRKPFVDKPTFDDALLPECIGRIMNWGFLVMPWAYLTKRDLLIEHEISFPNIIRDDSIWNWNLIFSAKRILRVPNVVYIWRNVRNSITRVEKTPSQEVNFWINPVALGMKTLNDTLDKIDFFRQNPQYRYVMLSHFVDGSFISLLGKSFQLEPFAVYESIKKEFGDKLGEQDILVSTLCTIINTREKISVMNQQKFNQFAAQAQKRIAELEAQLKTK